MGALCPLAGRQGPPRPGAGRPSPKRLRAVPTIFSAVVISLAVSVSLRGQIESIPSSRQHFTWVSNGRAEGHLALRDSPAAAFSPDSSTLAIVNEDKVALMDLAAANVRKVLRPRVESVSALEIHSANFLDSSHLFLLATGIVPAKDKTAGARTPLLAFQWDTNRDELSGKVNVVGAGGGFGAPRYFPEIRSLAMYKDSQFILWNPATGRGSRIDIAVLTRRPNLYEFSPDGHWLLLAQIEASGSADPVVVRLSEHQFVDSLRGHQGTVLSIAFSRDSRKVVTGCEDGKVRISSAPDWKLLQTLTAHQGPVHWAEFSSDGKWVASAGEDNTIRIWSAEDGRLEQSLQESNAPLLTVAFSPNDEYVAATSEKNVLVWKRNP